MKWPNLTYGWRKGVKLVASLGIFLSFAMLSGTSLAGIGKIRPAVQRDLALRGGQVLPPNTAVSGLTLRDMAALTAQFTTSGNQQQYYPNTPLQILYSNNGTTSVVNNGLLAQGTNNLTVAENKYFYVPIISVDDSPPVFGIFPTTSISVVPYWFSALQMGGRNFSIEVDGVARAIGPDYVVGPIETAPLQDGGGTHITTMGVFLTPMSKGTHVVTIKGGFEGSLIKQVLSVDFYDEKFTYTVIVQ